MLFDIGVKNCTFHLFLLPSLYSAFTFLSCSTKSTILLLHSDSSTVIRIPHFKLKIFWVCIIMLLNIDWFFLHLIFMLTLRDFFCVVFLLFG